MIAPKNPISASGRPTPTVGEASSYILLFAIQTIGAAILFWYAVPLFRQALLDPGSHVPRPENLVWSLSAITLMQAGYWIRHRLRPPLPQLRNSTCWLHYFICCPHVVRTGYLYFWFRLHCTKTGTLRTRVPIFRSHSWLVRLILLHVGTRATGKSIDRS